MRNLKKITIPTVLMIFTLLIIACSLSAVSAANQTISDSTAGGIAQGITDTENEGTLTLNPGTYNKTNQDTNISISKNITIKGNGSTDSVIIDAQRLSRIFTITNNIHLTFINITFINANITSNGGAIYNNYANSMMSFINCTFMDNIANTGGAIYNRGNGMSIAGTNFINNTATITTNGGGAILNIGNDTTVSDSNFIGNIAFYGGAFRNSGYNLTIINADFENNHAYNTGGALYGAGGENILVMNSTFNNNSVTNYYGGAIFANSNNWTIINSIFSNNNATNSSGAISISNNAQNSIVNNCSFINNSAIEEGGAISVSATNVIISNSTFLNNSAINGGGIFLESNHTTVINNTFINNSATNNGGGIFNNGTINLTGNIMGGNTAILGNDIFNNGIIKSTLNLIYLSNSTITTNKGSTLTLYATLTDDIGNSIGGLNISFYVNGIYVGSAESINGKASLTYTATTLGMLTVNGTCVGAGGSTNIKNGQLNVSKTKTILEVEVVGDEIIATLTDGDGNPIVGKKLILKDSNGRVLGVGFTNENGQVIFRYTGNSIYFTVSFDGSDSFSGVDVKFRFNKDDNNNEDNDADSDVDSDKASNNSVATSATMKNTGIPIIAVFLVLLSTLGICIGKKQN